MKKETADKGLLDFVHVVSESVQYDPRTGRKLSSPKLQYYTAREWGSRPSDGVQDFLRRTGATYTVLYTPADKDAVLAWEQAKPKKAAKEEKSDE